MFGFIKDKLFDGAWEIIKDEKKRRELRKKIEEQLNRENNALENCTHEEELDFQGLRECLLNKLTDENTIKKFAAIKKRRRDYIKKLIHKECLRDSKAETKQAKEKVQAITENCFSIVDSFLQSHVPIENNVLGGQIVDNVNEHTDENTQKIIEKSNQNKKEIINAIKENSASQNSSSTQPEKKEPTNDNDSYLKTFSELLFLEDDYEDENVVSLADMYISPSIGENKASECIKKWYHARTKPCLLLYGNAGVGKSSLVAKILADANAEDKSTVEFDFDSSKVMAVALRNHTDKIDIQLKAEEILKMLFNCDDVKQIQDKLLILDGLDELCVLKHDFNGELFLRKLSSLEYGYHVLVTSRESESYFTEPNNKKGLKTERLVWEEKQIKDWLDLYKAKKPKKKEWCKNFDTQFTSLEDDDKRREIFAVPIILYICGTSETDIEDHSSIGSIYRDAFTTILMREHLTGQSNTDKFKEAYKEANMTAWQFTKELAYQMFLVDSLDLIDDGSKDRRADGFRNAQKRTNDILKEEYKIENPDLELKKELAVCPFAKENGQGGITFAHKTIYEYFTAVKLYEDYFAKFDDKYFNDNDNDTAAMDVTQSFIEAFRYDGIPGDIFSYLCKMNEEPFSTTLGYSMSTGLDYKKYEQKFVYAMQNHMYAKIVINRAIDEYLYQLYSEDFNGNIVNEALKYKSINTQISTAFANFTCFLTFHGFRNEEKIPECMLIGNFLHGSSRRADFIGWHLENANLQDAYLIGVCLQDANLTGAHLEGAHLISVLLIGADLSGADLTFAYLTRAHLEEANLEEAHLEGTFLYGAYLEYTHLKGAKYCNDPRAKTVFPEGFDPKEHGMIEVDILGNPVEDE